MTTSPKCVSDKPIVEFYAGTCRFIKTEYGVYDEEPHEYAIVWGIDHPRLPNGLIYTSSILEKRDDGSFETRNTIYYPGRPLPEFTEQFTQMGYVTRCNSCGQTGDASISGRRVLHTSGCSYRKKLEEAEPQ